MFSLHQILVCGCGLYVNCTLKANYLLPSSAFVFFSVNDSLNVGSPEFLSVVICKLNRLFLRFSQVFVVRLVPDVTKISFDEPVFYHFLLRAMHNDYRHIQVLTTYVRFLQAWISMLDIDKCKSIPVFIAWRQQPRLDESNEVLGNLKTSLLKIQLSIHAGTPSTLCQW